MVGVWPAHSGGVRLDGSDIQTWDRDRLGRRCAHGHRRRIEGDAARDELLQRGVDAGEIFHFVDGNQQLGPDPERNDYGSFLGFSDPDGNGFVVQEVRQAVRRGRPSGTDAEAEAAAVAHLGWLFPPTGGANHLSKFEAPAVRRACRGSTGADTPPGAGGCPTRGVETPCARRSAAQGLIPGVLAAA